MAKYDVLKQAVLAGDEATAVAEVKKALAAKADPSDVLDNGLIAGMEVVGKKFRSGEMFLPEVLLCAEVMHKGIDILNPLLAKSGKKSAATVVIGTVEGDIHDIGKKIVALLLEGNGFNVIDLGVDVKGEKFIAAIEKYKPQIVGMSALLTTTMPHMGEIIQTLKAKKLRDKVKVIVGGASVNAEFAKSIGADGYAVEAGTGVELAKKLIAAAKNRR
jgi:5-methyltetrahydrofolate--homocysteine methyltransferase